VLLQTIFRLTRQEYNQYGVKPTQFAKAATWEDHKHDHHNPWIYAAFVLHLHLKHDVKRERLTGIETHVFNNVISPAKEASLRLTRRDCLCVFSATFWTV
jgi:hypothetical protein